MTAADTLTFTVEDGDEQILPPGTEVISIDGNTAVVTVSYNYEQFRDPDSPPVVFIADILVAADGHITVERGVSCINFSNPVESRTTTRA